LTEQLYLTDSYRKELTAIVESVTEAYVVLDRTIFYPRGGGQPSDRGYLNSKRGRVEITDVQKEAGEIRHFFTGAAPLVGEELSGMIDWELRYAHMRHHTALHILCGAVYRLFGSTITGSQIYSDRARIDFRLEDLDRDRVSKIVDLANSVVREGREVSQMYVSREEAMSMSELIRVDPKLIPDEPVLRIVEIKGFDAQLDGGTHVANTAEVGKISVSKVQNKGKSNKRLEIVLERPSINTLL